MLQFVGSFDIGQVLSDSDFPVGTDFDRLLRLGAIEICERVRWPPPTGQGRNNYSREFKLDLCRKIRATQLTKYRASPRS